MTTREINWLEREDEKTAAEMPPFSYVIGAYSPTPAYPVFSTIS
jgi:hypothetical protein